MADIPNLELTYPINVAPLLFQSFVTFSLLSNLLNFRFWHKADVQALVDLLYSLIQSF